MSGDWPIRTQSCMATVKWSYFHFSARGSWCEHRAPRHHVPGGVSHSRTRKTGGRELQLNSDELLRRSRGANGVGELEIFRLRCGALAEEFRHMAPTEMVRQQWSASGELVSRIRLLTRAVRGTNSTTRFVSRRTYGSQLSFRLITALTPNCVVNRNVGCGVLGHRPTNASCSQ